MLHIFNHVVTDFISVSLELSLMIFEVIVDTTETTIKEILFTMFS